MRRVPRDTCVLEKLTVRENEAAISSCVKPSTKYIHTTLRVSGDFDTDTLVRIVEALEAQR